MAVVTSSPAHIIAALVEHRVVPVIRTATDDLAVAAVEALAAGGFTTFEITMTIPGALGVVAQLTATTDFLIGAGTVLDDGQARDCLGAGAKYLVAPCWVDSLPPLCRQSQAACLLGAMTPSEVRQATQAGADAVKIFPASSAGGPKHIAALRAVFPNLLLVPTGGVTVDNATAYRAAGAAFVGLGGDLIDEPALASGATENMTARARALLTSLADR